MWLHFIQLPSGMALVLLSLVVAEDSEAWIVSLSSASCHEKWLLTMSYSSSPVIWDNSRYVCVYINIYNCIYIYVWGLHTSIAGVSKERNS